MGYKSVAHYIILTSLVDNKGALPIPEFTELPPTAKTAVRNDRLHLPCIFCISAFQQVRG